MLRIIALSLIWLLLFQLYCAEVAKSGIRCVLMETSLLVVPSTEGISIATPNFQFFNLSYI